MNRRMRSILFAAAAMILMSSSTATLAGEEKELTFAAIATEEMAVVAERW